MSQCPRSIRVDRCIASAIFIVVGAIYSLNGFSIAPGHWGVSSSVNGLINKELAMNVRNLIAILLVGCALFYFSTSMAQEGGESSVELQAIVHLDYDGIFIEAPVTPDLHVMIVNVVGPDGKLLFSERSEGQPIGFFLDSGSPDGSYRFEVISVIGDQGQSLMGAGSEQRIVRETGRFKVSGSQIENPRENETQSEDSVSDNSDISWPFRIAGIAIDWLVADASADNSGIAAHGNTCVGDPTCDTTSIPVNSTNASFNDFTVLDDDENGFTDFEMIHEDGSVLFSLDNNLYTTYNDDTTNIMMQLDTAAENALISDSAGDVLLANGSVFIDSSKAKMIIGGTVEQLSFVDFELHASLPQFSMYDPGEDDSFALELAFDDVGFFSAPTGESFRRVMGFGIGAPHNSFFIDSSGNIGIGTGSPAASLNVVRSDGSAQVLVSENGAPATRTLFHLKNAGRTHFKIENTDAATQWVFTNTGTAFFISLQGTGSPEFKILNNGNAVLSGTLTQNSDVNAKTAITDIDAHEILSLVSALPVTKWEYKDARGEAHIGPMAQDFYAAFGLGKSETGISSIDTGGVALAAIKALNEESNSLKAQNVSIIEQNAALLVRVEQQQMRVEKLEQQQKGMQAMMATLIEAQQAAPVLTTVALN